ncbi:hypothetical protein K7X08_029254 [Anisodus acutangulus]|uniref:Uncharacterized protein n=1 Tax=Anisodus acutangulus TaxID=402998 RepID=A0A9Q1L4U7_9SOLA|nr:hypothetical protein K7X08_029254 [Anisodus acutangulus]
MWSCELLFLYLKRRKEASSAVPYEELTTEVLESSSSAFNLVEYDSDASTSSECEKGHNPYLDTDSLPAKGSGNETDRVKTRSEQQFPLPGEPPCVICGKYICGETEDDICSCKSELRFLNLDATPGIMTVIGGTRRDLLFVLMSVGNVRGQVIFLKIVWSWRQKLYPFPLVKQVNPAIRLEWLKVNPVYPKSFCNCIKGKMLQIYVQSERHQGSFSCHYCFDKAFDKFYDMYSATWKAAGLSIIYNSICCEDHFEWHRINCLSAGVEDSSYIVKKHSASKNYALSDFIF